jgi:outer membrane lipoprotein-sorting protein
LLFAYGVLFAQNTPVQVEPIVEKTVQKYNALSTFSLDFSMTVDENKSKSQSFTGNLLVKKEKYYLTFEDQIIANDGKMIWNYQKNANEVSFFEIDDDDDFSMFHPTKMLSNWKEEFTAKFIREDTLQKKRVNIVDMTFKKKSPFYKMRLFIDKTTSLIQQIKMYEMDGVTIIYTINKFSPPPPLADDKFIFNKNDYPNVQINDMR